MIRYLNNLKKKGEHEIAKVFLAKTDKRINLLKEQPFVGIASTKVKDVRGILITKHNKLYCKVFNSQITLLNMYDARINPKRNLYK